MRIRLVYEGELRANQRDPEGGQLDKLAAHKQTIRKEFHQQLKHLWATDWFLSHHSVFAGDYGADRSASNYEAIWAADPSEKVPLKEAVANNHIEFGYRFVPLVRKDWRLQCSLNILFLRHDPPGSVVSAGDLDNRVKTLIDTLRKPDGAQELAGNEIPAEGENPFYCLLEDDRLVSGLTVESDRFLRPPPSKSDGDKELM